MAQLVLRTSRGAGVNPWVIFRELRPLWDRTWRGGDFAIYKAGPKDAQIHVVGWSVASSSYVHHAMRGVLDGVLSLFCEKAYVRELPALASRSSLGYRIAWA